ncbi:hypothetical protein GGR21_003911 [Dysgonomonas hofstadii]|uniref:6-phosphogluconate dehydrogenase n=1 Tax=Dysgonomonas hofstadii TaxID=637886 RepID=A0A840CZ32_9BACT|nr:hypothetical protein [Dysgonomonas hofstadii]MBB4037985.1 hypothetical protein [Dysgonomonas hofstadii]
MKKFAAITIAVILVGLLIFGYIWYYVPYSDSGVKAGILNNVKHKGIIFKTYEGELIQSGFRPGQQGLQSNEFQFSVEDKELAIKLMSLSGQNVKLHYKEYYGKLPWRGYTKFVVDSIVATEPVLQYQEQEIPPHTGGESL